MIISTRINTIKEVHHNRQKEEQGACILALFQLIFLQKDPSNLLQKEEKEKGKGRGKAGEREKTHCSAILTLPKCHVLNKLSRAVQVYRKIYIWVSSQQQ